MTAYDGDVDAVLLISQDVDPRSLRIEFLGMIEAADKLADQTSCTPFWNHGEKLPRHGGQLASNRGKKCHDILSYSAHGAQPQDPFFMEE